MNDELSQKAIERAMGRRLGMSMAGRARLTAFNAEQDDWHGVCRHCGTSLTGTIKELSRPCSEHGGGDGP